MITFIKYHSEKAQPQWYGQISRVYGVTKTFLQEQEGQEDNMMIKDWTGLELGEIVCAVNSKASRHIVEVLSMEPRRRSRLIRITCPCDIYPLTPHFYIVKLGFTGVFIFSYFCSKT